MLQPFCQDESTRSAVMGISAAFALFQRDGQQHDPRGCTHGYLLRLNPSSGHLHARRSVLPADDRPFHVTGRPDGNLLDGTVCHSQKLWHIVEFPSQNDTVAQNAIHLHPDLIHWRYNAVHQTQLLWAALRGGVCFSSFVSEDAPNLAITTGSRRHLRRRRNTCPATVMTAQQPTSPEDGLPLAH